jgi:hypothetical protein
MKAMYIGYYSPDDQDIRDPKNTWVRGKWHLMDSDGDVVSIHDTEQEAVDAAEKLAGRKVTTKRELKRDGVWIAKDDEDGIINTVH